MQKILLLGASGLTGRALADALQERYQMIPAAGHQTPERGYCLPAEDPDRLLDGGGSALSGIGVRHIQAGL